MDKKHGTHRTSTPVAGTTRAQYQSKAARNLIQVMIPLLLLAAAVRAIAASPGAPPPTVVVAPVVEQDIVPATEYVGHVEAIQLVDLRARVEGFLEQVNFREGDFVHAGDLLYVIEQAPYQAKVAADKASVDAAEAELARATQHLQRLRAARTESIPATDIDSAVAAELTAKARLAGAQAALAVSRLDLEYTVIKAPISGRIGRTVYTKGNLLGPTSGPLSRIVQLDPIRVVYSISENDLAAIQKAMAAAGTDKGRFLTPQLRLADGEPFKGRGHVSFVDNQVDTDTGTVAVRAVFANTDGLLLPGQYVTVLVKAAIPKLLPMVPQNAVQQDQEGPFVLVVDREKRVGIRRVQTGPVTETMWAIESGLAPGELVIVQGVQKVQPGQTVKTAAAAAQGR
jgi:RND family efflux transporter MFP subunit